jgi:hypothetical protein
VASGNAGLVGVGALRSFGAAVVVDLVVAFGPVVGVIRSEGMGAPTVAKLIWSAGSDMANAKSELWLSRLGAGRDPMPVRCATAGLETRLTGAVSSADNTVLSEGNFAVSKLTPAMVSGPDSSCGSCLCARAPGGSWRGRGSALLPVSYRTADRPPTTVSPSCFGASGLEVSQPAIHLENPLSDVELFFGIKVAFPLAVRLTSCNWRCARVTLTL